MPWFPDFAIGVELARRQTQEAGRADPVTQYFRALDDGSVDDLERVWPGEVVVHDPRSGEVRGHRHLRKFVSRNKAFFAERHARTEVVASTCVGTRAVVEVLAHLDVEGQEVSWPVAVAVESPDDRSVVFRTYCSQWPVDGRRHLRPPILPPAAALGGDPDDVVARYQTALEAGDTEAVVKTFNSSGYFREPIGTHACHRGAGELRSFFTDCFKDGGGIGLQPCAVTDDGVRYALEYNVVRWGSHPLPAQAGLAIHERGPDGLLAAVRVYDDVEAPR
ncbi:MAG TPA: nuclear transport factor 2 family protein [Frankiaceae bacterium]|jgi:ketosteroid isomerase-like protein|nr:nuclear transport factor 2 family protein [Frankiaceae bacterium]